MGLDLKQESGVGLYRGEGDLGLVLEEQRFVRRRDTAEGHVAKVESQELWILFRCIIEKILVCRFNAHGVLVAEVARTSEPGPELCHVQELDVCDDERATREVPGNGGGPL